MAIALKLVLAAFAGAAMTVGGFLGFLQLGDNFHVVVPGELYRSAQPSPSDINYYAATYGIRTIVNLRGDNPEDSWYRNEIDASNRAGIQHLDFRLSASRELTEREALQIIASLRAAPKPILIHCQSGADRTGLVSVLYLQQIAGTDEATAERQLSLRFGHVGIPVISSAYAMDVSWEHLEKAFGLAS